MQDDKKYVLSIDLGTSSVKTALVSVYGEIAGSEFSQLKYFLYPDGGAEQDPRQWCSAILTSTKKLISKNLVAPENIVAVSVTAQWAGTVAVDKAGNPLMNAIIWMDSRGSEALKEIFKGFIKIHGYPLFRLMKWMKLTGGAPGFAGKDPLCHILWIKQNKPDVYKKTYKFLEPKDYINLFFTGKFVSTYDSILLYWVTDNRNPSHVVYSEKLLKMTGINRAKLPDLIKATDIAGTLKDEIAAQLGLKKETPVIASTPDVPCSSIGSGAVRDYEGYLYVGTSSWISAHVPFKKTDVVHNFGSFPSPVPGRYIILSEQQGAGNCLAWLRDNILYHKDELIMEESVPDIYKVMDKNVERVAAGANNLIFTPWLYGERTPADDSHIRASLFNLSLDNTRDDILRSVYEGVAFNSRWLLEPVEKFIGRPFAHLNFIGGGANSDVWSQIFADVFNRKIRQVKEPIYANTRGAAFLAAIALKYITPDDISRFVQIKDEYVPNPANRAIYKKLYKEFLKLYHAQKKACARMNSK
ncbi:MAG TPA: xylulose kinase [Deltaproteobacteria bacterium]|nr:xylulose kinase [Deltaproteobacteria bacterium]